VARTRTWLLRGLSTLLLLVIAVVAFAAWWLTGSLPRLDGQRMVAGLSAPVVLLRDEQGLLRIEGGDRADIAYGLGWAHAQERFFQMDLQRRTAAGELAGLFGELALESDRAVRVHRFRERSRRNLALATPGVRKLLEAYARGVNAGLEDLRSRPFEYALLQSEATPWRPEDSFLTLFAMTLMLQDENGGHERARGLMHDLLPADLFAFLTQPGGRWDAPLDGAAFDELPPPDTGLEALRGVDSTLAHAPFPNGDLVPGSNNWAVAGSLTAHGGAIVADDMHLGIRVPNTWYRAAWTDPRHGRTVSGVTLPGVPFMVAGSNGRVAWGFTNTQGDWSDIVELAVSEDGGRYRTPEGWEAFRTFEERIAVKGGEDQRITVRETRWGPVIGEDHRGRLLALRWTAHDPEGANFNVTGLELADSVFDPLGGAHRFGIPHQNLVLGDRDGNIAWTIAGPVPRRVGFDGRLPGPWHDGSRAWDGYLEGQDHPRRVNPPSGRLWTANARVLSGPEFETMGEQGAALGARQQQIRDRLMAMEQAGVQDMLALQLDDEARFLARWRGRLLDLLSPDLTTGDPSLLAARTAVENWSGRASEADVGYRLVRNFRLEALGRVGAPFDAFLRAHDDRFRMWRLRQFEYPAWTLLEARPPQLLDPSFDSWEALELDALRAVVDPMFDDRTLENDPWGEQNRLAIRHPLASAVPLFGRWLTLPDTPMNGDAHMPRVQSPSAGASQRFGVSPGRESEAYLHMPGGQSAHPLSPFFIAGHEDWVEGRASNWLPGEPVHRLELSPADADPPPRR
jgi:penicillin amidase